VVHHCCWLRWQQQPLSMLQAAVLQPLPVEGKSHPSAEWVAQLGTVGDAQQHVEVGIGVVGVCLGYTPWVSTLFWDGEAAWRSE